MTNGAKASPPNPKEGKFWRGREEASRDWLVPAWRAGLAGGGRAVSSESVPRSGHHPSGAIRTIATAHRKMDFVSPLDFRGEEIRGDRQAFADWGANGAAAHALEGRISFLHRANHSYRDALLASVDERSRGCVEQERAAR